MWLGHNITFGARPRAPQGSAPRGKIENTPAALEYARDDPRGCVVCVDNLELDTPREQPACRTRCPKEPHAQRSWHLQRSPPAQSEDLPPEVWLPTLSDDERLLYAARSRVLLDEPLFLSLFLSPG